MIEMIQLRYDTTSRLYQRRAPLLTIPGLELTLTHNTVQDIQIACELQTVNIRGEFTMQDLVNCSQVVDLYGIGEYPNLESERHL